MRLSDGLVEIWWRLRKWLGFDRLSRTRRRRELPGRSWFGRLLYFLPPLIALVVIVYLVTLIARFTFIRGDELDYPQQALSGEDYAAAPGAEIAGEGPPRCAPSRIAEATAYVVDVLVDQNVWVPGDPQYKLGWFGLVGFAPTPFFDNKASFQLGAIRTVRRMAIEMNDLVGRARGTSAADPDLEDARGALQWNERAWWLNPFDSRLQLLSTSAASSFRDARARLLSYNRRLEACDALFDPRADNLFQLLDRIANDVGATTDQLARRSQSEVWSPREKRFVEGAGNDRGVFDFRADNLFSEARGLMWAYHGILQAARADFAEVVRQRNLGEVWDRMEAHVAEAAALEPWIVSNGAEDGIVAPDHLSVMAENMLRARANMTELREILAR